MSQFAIEWSAAAENTARQRREVAIWSRRSWVYNPLDYAWQPHQQYLRKYATPNLPSPLPWNESWSLGHGSNRRSIRRSKRVTQWLGIDAPVSKPDREHPKRPIEGLSCTRSEVSGRRLWGLFQERFCDPSNFFKHHSSLITVRLYLWSSPPKT